MVNHCPAAPLSFQRIACSASSLGSVRSQHGLVASHLPAPFLPHRQATVTCRAAKQHNNTIVQTFPFQQFQVHFILISKFFSSFARATCLLSVFRPYLALRGMYLALCAAIPNYTTLLIRGCSGSTPSQGYHLLWLRFPSPYNASPPSHTI